MQFLLKKWHSVPKMLSKGKIWRDQSDRPENSPFTARLRREIFFLAKRLFLQSN
jgi:hypothetical protein